MQLPDPAAAARAPRPARGLERVAAYRVPRPDAPLDLYLDGNEGPRPDLELLRTAALDDVERARRYPDARPLEAALAARLGVAPERVLVTAGADDALLRACLAFLEEGRELLLPTPTFEMIPRYARQTGATLREVAWPGGPYPTDAVLAQVGERTAMVAVVSPNNPTGAVASPEDLARLSAAAPGAVLLVDQAYAEYADPAPDLTAAALELPNALVARTLSKAWGLAGLRVGYAVGPPELVGWLRRAGNPYPVAGPALAAARAWLAAGEGAVRAHVAAVRAERARLVETLARLGAAPEPSQANFVFARFRDAALVRDALAERGIAVRAFPGRPGLEDALRITCPGEAAACARLERALEAALAPAA